MESFRLSAEPSQYHMDQPQNYTNYALRVHEIRQAPMFTEFYRAFNLAFEGRLTRVGIATYLLTEVRAIEAAAFELAGNANDET